ncbi:MAG: site-specific integrase [Ignavibacteria bacterium]|nr:site-specific integrase [Ignavibacteria bacterium]
MASLYKKRGLWHIAYIIGGKREVKNTNLKATASTKTEATKLKKEIENLIASKKFIVGRNTLGAMCDKYRNEHLKLKSKSHQDMFNNCINHFAKIVSLDTNVDEINSAHIAEFINRLTDSVSNATLLTYISYLKMLFNFLLEEDLILKNPIKRRQIPERIKKKIVFFGKEVLSSILDLAKERDEKYYLFLKMLLLTGQRPNDILQLKKSQVNLQGESILVNISKTKIQISFPIYKELRTFIKKELKFINNLGEDDLIFSEFNSEIVHKRFQRIKKTLKLKGEHNTYTLKTFRKTFASNFASKGLDNSKIADLLGHSDPKITKKYYTAVSTESLRKAMDEALKGKE